MIPAITHDDAARIRANLERAGRPVPPALRDVTDAPAAAPAKSPAVAKPAKAPAAAKPAAAPAKAPRTAAPSKPPAAQRGAAGPSGAAGPTGGAGRSGKSGGREVTGRQVASAVGTRAQRSGKTAGKRFRSILRSPSTLGGSDGGGLLLTFWLYPLVLAIVQEGAKGPGIWLRAKFLNIGTQPPTGAKWKAPAAADIGPTKPLPASTANATPPGASTAPAKPGTTPSAPAPGTPTQGEAV